MEIILKFIKNNWQYFAIGLLILTIYLGSLAFINMRDNYNRVADNMQQEMLEYNTKVLEMTKSEFKQYKEQKDSLLIELMDSLKLNYRHIIRTVNHKYTHSFDTTITMIKEVDPKKDTVRTFRLDKDCVKIVASINWKANTAKLDTVNFNYNATTIYYWERKHKVWFIQLGRKKYYAATTNNCTGITKVIDIKFEK